MKVLVFGSNGQVGTEAVRQGQQLGWTMVAADRSVVDLTRPERINAVIQQVKPDAVLNAAAYTAVDRAEADPDVAALVNGSAPRAMAETCADLNVPMVHYSTDYVFDGSAGQPYREEDSTNPLGVYGRTKLSGERGVLDSKARAAVIRLAWVFSEHGSNFVKTMLRLATTMPQVRVVADQIGAPTAAADAAKAGLKALEALQERPDLSGLYHLGGKGIVSWAEFAEAIFACAGLNTKVTRITTADYPTPTQRPAYSALATQKITAAFGVEPSDWRMKLQDVMTALNDQKKG